MNYEITKNKITVFDLKDFDIEKTLQCGQVFRYKNQGEYFEIITENHRAELRKMKNNVIICCDDEKYFEKYFDLSRNYDIIRIKLKDKGLFDAAIDFGKGIRILRQNPLETLISFIISANNHIPRIKNTIERLCSELGEDCGGYYAFPTAEALAQPDADFYKKCGLGYRADYVNKTANAIINGFDLQSIYSMPTNSAHKTLCRLSGVGPKVADCVLLFGYNKTDVFPVDTWIIKAYNSYFGKENNPKKIREALIEQFGDLSGFAQQYLFFYKRELDYIS